MLLILIVSIGLSATPDDAINSAAQNMRLPAVQGNFDENLYLLAVAQAAYCAQYCQSGHQLFGSQFATYTRPGLSSVVAESWGWQDMCQSSVEAFKCWKASSGHWETLQTPYKRYAFAMRQGRNNIWYCAGYFSN